MVGRIIAMCALFMILCLGLVIFAMWYTCEKFVDNVQRYANTAYENYIKNSKNVYTPTPDPVITTANQCFESAKTILTFIFGSLFLAVLACVGIDMLEKYSRYKTEINYTYYRYLLNSYWNEYPYSAYRLEYMRWNGYDPSNNRRNN